MHCGSVVLCHGGTPCILRLRAPAELLVALARRIRIDDALRPAFEAAAQTIGSSHENDRVMAALARSQGRSPEGR